MIRSRKGWPASRAPRPVLLLTGLLLFAVLANACAPGRVRVPQPIASPTVNSPAHAPEIRLALIGQVTHANVWALFGGPGSSYNNYAVRSQYWPRLYGAAIPDQSIVPVVAVDPPPVVGPEGTYYSASVSVRTDLKWSDGTAFTAEDIAFTVNAALTFRLGFDWHDYYNPEWLDHAEAASAEVVKFYFKQPPGIRVWQYGALRGPVVQEAFWSTKVAEASSSLPTAELQATIDSLQGKILTLQSDVNELYAATLLAQGEQARELQAELKRQQGNLDEAINARAEAESSLQAAMEKARQSLFAQDDRGEPLLGPWLPDISPSGSPSSTRIVNVANSSFPGALPNFDRAIYSMYETRRDAEKALESGEANVILDPQPATASSLPTEMKSPTRSLRFLAFNLKEGSVFDASLRSALACVVDQGELAGLAGERALALDSFIAAGEGGWYDAGATLPCSGLGAAARVSQAAEMLSAAGYTWRQKPTTTEAAQGLTAPDSRPVPTLQVLAPESDAARQEAARYVERQGRLLGIPIQTQVVTADVIDYVVLSSSTYDMAVLGWKVSPDPDYLCDWFGASGPFNYEPTELTSLCGELAATSDLVRAQALVQEIQKTLAEEIPMLPLFSTTVSDSYRGLEYPFATILDGLIGVYGAPELAAPAVP